MSDLVATSSPDLVVGQGRDLIHVAQLCRIDVGDRKGIAGEGLAGDLDAMKRASAVSRRAAVQDGDEVA